MSVTHICRTCHSGVDVKACVYCRTSFYCSKKCQRLDWNQHQTFCLTVSSPEVEKRRREHCLELIYESGNTIFSFLMRSKYTKREGFLLLREKGEPHFMPKNSVKKLKNFGIPIDKRIMKELNVELDRPKTKKTGIVVLHASDQDSRVYIVGSEEISSLEATISKMPMPLLVNIFTNYLENRLSTASSLDRFIMAAMIGHGLRTGKNPTEEGGFLDSLVKTCQTDKVEAL